MALTVAPLAAACGAGTRSGATTEAGTGATMEVGTEATTAAAGSSKPLRVGSTRPIDSLNILAAQGGGSYSVIRQIYPSLTQYDFESNEILGDYATAWAASADGREWTFDLHAGGEWSDGTALTAADVAWSLNVFVKYKDGATGAFGDKVANIAEAVAMSDEQVVIRYTEALPETSVLEALTLLPVLPEHVWGQYATGDGSALKTFTNEAPVVCGGAFVLKEHRPKEFALLEANPGFYGDKPLIPSFGIKYYGTVDAMLVGLKAGDFDVTEVVEPSPAVTSLEAAGLTLLADKGYRSQYIAINVNPKKSSHHELLDVNVRKALNHAIDRQKIVDVVYLGYAVPATTMLPSSVAPWYNTDLEVAPFDLGLANELLDTAGYVRGSDGVRRAGDVAMEYVILGPSEDAGIDGRILEISRSDWEQIGVKISWKFLDAAALFTAELAPDGKYLTNDIAIWGFTLSADPNFPLYVLTKSAWGAWNDTAYDNPTYNELYDQQLTTLDATERQDLIWQLQGIAYDDLPYLNLVYGQRLAVYDGSDWEGFEMSPSGIMSSYGSSMTRVRSLA